MLISFCTIKTRKETLKAKRTKLGNEQFIQIMFSYKKAGELNYLAFNAVKWI